MSEESSDLRTSPRSWAPLALLPVIVSGSVKASGLDSLGPVDLTLGGAFVLVVTATVTFTRHPRYPFRQMLPFFVFALVALLGVVRTMPSDYSALKTRDFFLMTTVIVACTPILLRNRLDLRMLALTWFASGTLVAVLTALVGGDESLYGRAGIGGATLGPAYLSAAALVAGVAGLSEKLIPAVLAVPGVVISGFALITIASRGPMLAACAGLAAWLLLRWRLTFRSVLAIALLAISVTLGLQNASEVALDRLAFEDSARVYLWATAWNAFLDNPVLGLGWAGFAELPVFDLKYPHNIILETLAELGLVGLLALFWVFLAAIIAVVRARSHPEVRLIAALAVIGLTGQLFSADLSNRVFWIALVPCLVVATIVPPPIRSASITPERASQLRTPHGRPPLQPTPYSSGALSAGTRAAVQRQPNQETA